MKRCRTCGHTNGRLRPVKARFFDGVIPGEFECVSPRACIRRMELIGEWVGKRVLRRIEADGSEWTIRKAPPDRVCGCGDENGLDYTLTMTYRDHRLVSQHADIEAAKNHADDLLASWRANSLREYARSQR